ncbi:MAG: hypothetical protein NZM28_07225 [Fimbriimonadales bacterium]|nr:hypothetical protein [Fimbriimonadales bacterium]
MKGIRVLRALGALGLTTAAITLSAAQTQLAFWNFNESNPLDQNAMLAADGGIFASQAQISIALAEFRFSNNPPQNPGFRGSPLDPNNQNHPTTPNWGLQTTQYPAQEQNPGQAGIVVSVPTTGYKDIKVKFDVRWSNTASKFLAVEYTTDGGNSWTRVRTLEARRGDRWHGDTEAAGGYNSIVEIDLSSDTSVNNNGQFAFRVVTIFDPNTGQYTPANAPNSPNYTPQGTLRYDLIEVLGTEIPSGPEGDVNGDGCVDDADLLQVLFNFGGNDAASDVNDDGVVDDADLLIVLFNFGTGCGG